MASVEYSEIYLDAISLVRFFRIIVRLMREVGIDDFGMRDLIRPEPQRLKIILSAVINFAKFREEQLTIYEELNRKTEDIYAEKDRLLARHQDLSTKISTWKRQLQDEEPRVQKIREHNNQMIQELRELKKEQTTLTDIIEELKAHRTNYSERLVPSILILGSCPISPQ
jgi:DNA repair exonuclease SbcCD ATPase subunit